MPKIATKKDFTPGKMGLEFIAEALKELSQADSQRDLKYPILHLSTGIELILKDRLLREHWALVFEKPENASRVTYDSGNFTSVSFSSCVKRLVEICGLHITESEQSHLRQFRDKRNRIEHFGRVDSAEALKSSAARVLSFLVDFIDAEFDHERLPLDSKLAISDIQTKLSDFKEFVSKRLKAIENKLPTDRSSLIECSGCAQKTAVINQGVKCLFCGRKSSGEEAAQDYDAEFVSHKLDSKECFEPTARCPSCEHISLLDRCIEATDQARYLCFHCGRKFRTEDLDFCTRCCSPVHATQNNPEGSLCDECRFKLS